MTRAVRPIVPSRIAGTLGGHESARAPRTVLGGYLALTKPRVIELLLVTTLPAMVLAGRSWPSWSLVAVVLVGGALAAGGANAVNMYVDRDIDRLMARTAGRPLVTGLIRPRDALVFAVALEAAAFALLATGANVLSAVLVRFSHSV
jgi:protoheme IX farnesyltransferase